MTRSNSIVVTGARENNLKNVSVTIPKHALTVFTGVSGSGKSSLVFNTIAAESRRLINETYPSFVQGFMETQDRPDVDGLEGLTAAIIVDQERMGSNPRSTVGTVTDVTAYLRRLYATIAQPHIGGPGAYSFNVPSVSASGVSTVGTGEKSIGQKVTYERTGGQCPRCEGMGQVTDIDLSVLFDDSLPLCEATINVPGYNRGGWNMRLYLESGLYPTDKPIKNFTKKQRHDFLYKDPTRMKIAGINMTYEGLIPRITNSILSKDYESMQPAQKAFVDRAVTFQTCPECEGTRLAQQARSSTVCGTHIGQLCAMSVVDLREWMNQVTEPQPLVALIKEALDHFIDIGLGYLTLDRPAGTLSGGEAQRTKMIRHLGSALTDVTYVFDEPSAGLHPHDIGRLTDLLASLRNKGNTVLVVEHNPQVIRCADYIVDVGPGAGSAGGEVVYCGRVSELTGTVTAASLAQTPVLKETVRSATGTLKVRNARLNNLHGFDVAIPTGILVALTGVAGSGKSSLVEELVAQNGDVVVVDQNPIKGSRRSNPGTYSGALDPIRKAFAQATGTKPGLFSANSHGACPICNGAGVLFTDVGFLATVQSTCEECGGLRFKDEVLALRLNGKNIAEVLDMTVSQAHDFFDSAGVKPALKVLARLIDVGLGYITLGQPLTSLSGGERQRLKLAEHIGSKRSTFVLDEPTTGLHMSDVAHFLEVCDRLVNSGRTVIVVEHNRSVIIHADWIIEMGPGAGNSGGTIVFEGTPAELADADTLTGQHVSEYLTGR